VFLQVGISNPLVAGSSPPGRANSGPVCGPPCKDETQADTAEFALADALARATSPGAWSTVERLAAELESRRRERSRASGDAEVVSLPRAASGSPLASHVVVGCERVRRISSRTSGGSCCDSFSIA